MSNKCKLVIKIVLFLCAIATVAVVLRKRADDPMRRLSNPRHRVDAFGDLLEKNHIVDLPDTFRFKGEGTRIEYYSATDSELSHF